MVARSWTLAVLVLSFSYSSAAAEPTTVDLRVEGASSTIFEGAVVTDAKTIDKGSGPHPCDGTNGGASPGPGPTMTSALDDGSIAGGFPWDGTWFAGFDDFGIDRIGPDATDLVNFRFWGYALNFRPTQVGGCQQRVVAGDRVLFGYDFFSKKHLLELTGPAKVATGGTVTVTVTDGQDGSAIPGAGVGGAVTDAGGSASLRFDSPGVRRLKAEKPDSLRSNALEVCVYEPGSGACDTPSAAPVVAPVRDSKAPAVRISGPRSGRRYRRGPRLLRGTASDSQSGLKVVKLALRRHVRGAGCRWWSGRRERFVGNGCRKIFFFAIGDDPDWSYLLPRRLARGRYVLDVKAFDRVRNRDERFERGRNRVVFEVAPRRRRARAVAARRRGVVSRVMVVGRRRTLVDAVRVRARSRSVRATGRRCRLGASTPMAALVAALRRARVGYHVRDFGRCSGRRAGGSGQLFVDRIGSDRNRGRDGWVYKVGDRAGTAGAADPTGPFGAGLLRPGARVVWFYCTLDVAARSCQPTLRLFAHRRRGRVGGMLRIRVRSYDDAGRGRPAAGVTVTLGGESAVTDERGVARLRLAVSGRRTVTAGKAGAVRAFPISVRARG